MSDLPDFSNHHYHIEKELGCNRAGGRVTYLATSTQFEQLVVIKQFQFAKLGTSWQGYDAYLREIQLLKELNHPGIPRYIDSFQTEDGFCMVQEYKKATSLATSHSFSPDEIRHIATSTLEILIYLQNRIPPIIHRDIKPENILVGEDGNVYLIDFGFARVGEGEVGVSSVVKGTLGFMPPEQLFNRQLTEASDLYGLGMSLICLLTGTKSDCIGDLVDISYRVSFKHLVPKLNIHWVNWLEKMVEPRLKDRFPNAMVALAAMPNTPIKPPEAQFSESMLKFKAVHVGKPLIHSVTITNPIPNTELEGTWKVAPHPHDPPPDRFKWIMIEPSTFVGNRIECQITVNTKWLMAGKTYSRQLLLHANTLAKSHTLTLQIETAKGTQLNWRPYVLLGGLCLFSMIISCIVVLSSLVIGGIPTAAEVIRLSAVLSAGIGLQLSAWLLKSSGWHMGSTASVLAAIVVFVFGVIQASMLGAKTSDWNIAWGAIAGIISGALVGSALGVTVENLIADKSQEHLAIASTLLAAFMGTGLGIGWVLGFENILPLTLVVGSGLGLIAIILHHSLKQHQTLTAQRKTLRHLIKP
jgi:serine/threonine protein kinase